MASYNFSPGTTTVSSSGINHIDSLLDGIKWGGLLGTGMNLSYSFPWTSFASASWQSSYSSDNEPSAIYHFGLSSNQITAASSALQSWANIANVSFAQIAETNTEVGDFRLAFSSAVTSDTWGWSYTPDNYWANSGDIWINTSYEYGDFGIGKYNYQALIHEIGHSLGLKHPGDYDSTGNAAEGPFLPNDLDSTLYSSMSYNDPNVNVWLDAQTNSTLQVNAETPMVLER